MKNTEEMHEVREYVLWFYYAIGIAALIIVTFLVA